MLSVESIKQHLKKLHDDAEKNDDPEQMKKLNALLKPYRGPDELVSSTDIAARIKASDDEESWLTGFPSVDKLLRGFRPGQLVVVTAATKSGKTSWCVQVTDQMAAANPLWLPFEESADELVRKFIESGQSVPHFVTPSQMRGDAVAWVEMKIVEAVAKFNTRVVFIDHLHFMIRRSHNLSAEVGFVVRELKTIAKRWNVVIVLIAHLRKTDVEQEPDLDDLRDSSFIAQDADTVIILWREHKRVKGSMVITNNVNLSIQANRRFGVTGNIQLVYDNGLFREQSWRTDDIFDSI